MNNENCESLILWPKMVMILGGLWAQPISKNRLVQNLFLVYGIFWKTSLYVGCFLMKAEFIRLIACGYSLDVISTVMPLAINATKIEIKLFIYMRNNVLDMFKDVIEKEREIWGLSEEAKKVYIGKSRLCRLFVIVLLTISTFTLCFLEIVGGIATFRLKRYNEANNETLESHFMLPVIYPRDKLANLNLTFGTQVLWTWVAFIYNCATHIIFLTLLAYSVSRLEVLQVRLRTYIEPDFSDDPTEEEVKEKVKVLKSLIDEHKYIIRFIEDLNRCTKNIVMMEFLMGSLDISAVIASMMKIDMSQIAWELFLFVLLVCEMLLLAWTCNEVRVQSVAIGDAAYESRWYVLNKDAKQLTMIMMARAQIPLVITIGPFGPMTTNSAISVMKAAYSYVSIMSE